MDTPYPSPSSPQVSARLSRVRRSGTKPEVAVRSALHAAGLRYRVDLPVRLPELTVRPDIVFTRARVAVFIDGCFWHSCPEHGNQPRANTGYWLPKLQRNVERDRTVDDALTRAGWRVLRYWEHESPLEVADHIRVTIGGQTGPT